MKHAQQFYFRKVHRWIGVFVGVQLLMWTASGIYFSWTDLDEIHGDQFIAPVSQSATLSKLKFPDSIPRVSALAMRFIDGRPYLWVNDSVLVDAESGEIKAGVTAEEAERIARLHVKEEYNVNSISLLTQTSGHHEYRGRPLPAWVVTFEGPTPVTAYVAERDGSFQRVRHQSWRIFDFLWMLHTMDYQGRDDFNNSLIRFVSLLAAVVVLSGLTLFYLTQRRRAR